MATPQEHAKYAEQFLVIARMTTPPHDRISIAVAGEIYWKATVQAAQAIQGAEHPADGQHIRLRNQIRNAIGRAGFGKHQQNRLRNTLNSLIVNLHGASYEPHLISPADYPTYAAEAEYLTAILLSKAPR